MHDGPPVVNSRGAGVEVETDRTIIGNHIVILAVFIIGTRTVDLDVVNMQVERVVTRTFKGPFL